MIQLVIVNNVIIICIYNCVLNIYLYSYTYVMSIINQYDSSLLKLHEPIGVEYDKDTYMCELSYNNKPFIVNNLPHCKIDTILNNNYLHLTIHKQYALFFDTIYNELLKHIYTNSSEWFEDELSMEEIEATLIHPLKINIKRDVYDLKIKLSNNFYCIDEGGNLVQNDINNRWINPVIHIKSVIFGTKQFYIDLELISCCIQSVVETTEDVETTEETTEGTSEGTSEETNVETNVETSEETTEGVETSEDVIYDDLKECTLNLDDDDDSSIVLDTHTDIHTLVETKIKKDIILYLKKNVLSNRKIKFNLEDELFETDYLLNA